MKQKYCWLATETAKGWRVKLCIGNKLKYPVAGLLCKNQEDVVTLFGHGDPECGKLVSVWMKNNPKRNKIDRDILSKHS